MLRNSSNEQRQIYGPAYLLLHRKAHVRVYAALKSEVI